MVYTQGFPFRFWDGGDLSPQGGIKFLASWEMQSSAWYFARNSGSPMRHIETLYKRNSQQIKPIIKIQFTAFVNC